MLPLDPTAGNEPRDRINYALGVLMESRKLAAVDAFRLVLGWSSVTQMSVLDVADLVIAGSRAGGLDSEQ